MTSPRAIATLDAKRGTLLRQPEPGLFFPPAPVSPTGLADGVAGTTCHNHTSCNAMEASGRIPA